ncbi:MAG: hypothetical protein KBH07_09670 [Flavobacteriales bacterium]|nr:hypothetical protein [Flavobacteriales bacterium]MBP9080237.1 hypothetical protein [Flavobacteriales bacterium]
MERRSLVRWSGGLVAMGLFVLQVHAGGFRVEGRLEVEGMSMEGARVIVVGGSAGPVVLDRALDQFRLDLELNAVYLCSFERPGCVGKELLIDTHLPATDVGRTDFTFPLKVALSPPPRGQFFTYAGPVGRIHYDGRVRDFRFDTSYRTGRDELLEERMVEARATVENSLPEQTRLPARRGRKGAQPVIREQETIEVFTTLAPTVGLTAPLVQATHGPADTESTRVLPHHPEELTIEPVDEPVLVMAAVLPKAIGEATSTAVGAGQSTMEVHAGKLMLITIVRVDKGEVQDEYRRVVSYYGGTTYFKNGLACSVLTYLQGIAE